jgi:hypothetical protein
MVLIVKTGTDLSSEFERNAETHLKDLFEKQPFAKVVFDSLD